MGNESRNQDSTPTMKAILNVVQTLTEIQGGEKPANAQEAKTRLDDIAQKMNLDSGSLLRKVQRLDKSFHSQFSEIIKAYLSADVTPDKWREKLAQSTRQYNILRAIGESYQNLIGGEQTLILEVTTSTLLSSRFWPSILTQFREEMPLAHVRLTTLEPYLILKERKELMAHSDMLVTYCSPDEFYSMDNSHFDAGTADIHRCLIAPKGPQWQLIDEKNLAKCDNGREGKHNYVANQLKGKRFAMLREARRIIPTFPWHKIEETADIEVRSSSQECIGCCMSGFAATVTHLELLNELEQKSLNYWELDENFGGTIIAMLARKRGHAPNEKKESALALLKKLVTDKFESMEINYKLSKNYSALFSRLEYSYHTRIVNSESREYEWRRGVVSVKVTPDLFVTGRVTVCKDEAHPFVCHHVDKEYPLFGRILKPKDSSAAIQMGLRGMNEEKEFFYASFIFINSATGFTSRNSSKGGKPFIIGKWIGGGEAESGSPTPNLGTWIWHSDKALKFNDLQSILDAYKKSNEITFFPSKPQLNQKRIWGVLDETGETNGPA